MLICGGLGAGGAFFLASAQLSFLYSTFESYRSFSVPEITKANLMLVTRLHNKVEFAQFVM